MSRNEGIDEPDVGGAIDLPVLPTWRRVSGLYTWTTPVRPIPPRFPVVPGPIPGLVPSAGENEAMFPIPIWIFREELRLDVDGWYPQMSASGTLFRGITSRLHWIAHLTSTGPNAWTGTIWYKDGDTAVLPQTEVNILATTSLFPAQRRVRVTFTGAGVPTRTITYQWKSAYFRKVEFEFDTVEGTTAITQMNTGDHPNRPASLGVGPLSIDTVFRRAGIEVSHTGGDGSVPLVGSGPNARWSDAEMHDAMQAYWSRFADTAQWSMWVLFASLHEMGSSLGGIMFDDIGPNHRQGTALFNDSFIKNAPAGDPSPDAWVRRMKFWTACHEMGHAFNLAHSWQKGMPVSWIPLVNEPEARSFMNYPHRVAGGQAAFFANFDFRFSEGELLFLRHAPERLVEMGNAEWFDHHGFRQAETALDPDLVLEVRVHRVAAPFEFLEPVNLELKLTNRSREPKLVPEGVLTNPGALTVILKRKGAPARQWAPYASICTQATNVVLNPGDSIYGTLNVTAGLNGFDVAEPGRYAVQVALHLGDEDYVSNRLVLRVATPTHRDEEYLAQDLFTDDVGRTLAFNGTVVLAGANNTLREVVERLPGRRIANHARLALAGPMSRDFKVLSLCEGRRAITSAVSDHGEFRTIKAQSDAARDQMTAALTREPSAAADTLGHIEYRRRVEDLCEILGELGELDDASACAQSLHHTLSTRGVLPRVLDEVGQLQSLYASGSEAKTLAKHRTKRHLEPSVRS